MLAEQIRKLIDDWNESLGAAIESAADALPEGYWLRIAIEKHGFDAKLVLPDNGVIGADRETLVDEIEELVEIAVKHSEAANTAREQYEQKWGDTERVSSLSKITTKDVENFEFIGITPDGGKAYYSEDLDVAVIHYGDYTCKITTTELLSMGKLQSVLVNKLSTE